MGDSILPTMEHNQSILPNMEHNESILSTMEHSESILSTMEHNESILPNMEHNRSILHTMEHSDSTIPSKEQTPPSYKRVTWDTNLCQIRIISPRDTEQVFPVPASLHEDTFNLTIYKIPQPWEIESGMFEPDLCFTNTNTSQPRCSEHVITVVDRARTRKQISGNTEKMRCNSQPDRTKLKLHFKNPLYENLTETVV